MSDQAEVIRNKVGFFTDLLDDPLPSAVVRWVSDIDAALSELTAERDVLARENYRMTLLYEIEPPEKDALTVIEDVSAERDRLREALREIGFATIHCTHGSKVRRILERAALSQPPQGREELLQR